jgi:hypothetical protein
MRGATECAKRLKLLFSSLRAKLGKVGHPPITDPITQMLLGILSRDTPESKASDGLERLRSMVVDYNELRVIAAIELAEVLADFPDVRLKCEDISRALNAVFAREHSVSLDRLAELPRKEVIASLEEIEGLEAYSRARVRLLGLQQHAIPLDEAMWAYARQEEIVDRRCPLQEAQAFLERQISDEDALEFVALLKKQAWNEMGAAVQNGEVPRITSIPPDRTARNMLQTVSIAIEEEAGLAESGAAAGTRSTAEPAKAEPSHVARKRRRAPRKSSTRAAASPKAKPRPRRSATPKSARKPKASRARTAERRGRSARSARPGRQTKSSRTRSGGSTAKRAKSGKRQVKKPSSSRRTSAKSKRTTRPRTRTRAKARPA